MYPFGRTYRQVMTTGEAPQIGTAIRRMRRWRGMTLDALAGLSGP
nr:hypothetical protein GCM10020241_34330 [Streptoalloteichus tenebrarius]